MGRWSGGVEETGRCNGGINDVAMLKVDTKVQSEYFWCCRRD
jgi:hypothetical protein